jgi:hypothetical protein
VEIFFSIQRELESVRDMGVNMKTSDVVDRNDNTLGSAIEMTCLDECLQQDISVAEGKIRFCPSTKPLEASEMNLCHRQQ